jgi:hypothetical protein
MAAAAPPVKWGTCTLCGDAVPPGAKGCPTCGYERAVAEGQTGHLRRRERWRLRSVQALRVTLVVGIAGFLAYLMVSAAASGPPTYTDPLTTAATHPIAPGGVFVLSGNITGEDYIVGNYTVLTPPGALATLLIMNDSEYNAFTSGAPETPLETLPAESSSQIVFSAPYTDMFHFVFENQYPASSGLSLSVYVVTNYESNVVLG